jgi:hypothetical protein
LFSGFPRRSASHAAKQFGGLLLSCPALRDAQGQLNQGVLVRFQVYA